MKKLIIVTVIATCLILCAAMWPQAAPTEKASVTPLPPAVTDTQPAALEALETKELIVSEEEKTEIPPLEIAHSMISESEPAPSPMPVVLETQVIAEPEPADVPVAPVIQPAPGAQTAPAPTPAQTVIDPQPGEMVYVPGFGWLESQGPGEVIYDTKIYENGNKIGSMG